MSNSVKSRKVIFDDTSFPSQIKMVDEKGQMLNQKELDSSSMAKDEFKKTIVKSAEDKGTFLATVQAGHILRAVDLFEAITISVDI